MFIEQFLGTFFKKRRKYIKDSSILNYLKGIDKRIVMKENLISIMIKEKIILSKKYGQAVFDSYFLFYPMNNSNNNCNYYCSQFNSITIIISLNYIIILLNLIYN